MTNSKHHLKAGSLALALGITWGLGMLLVAWVSWWCSGGSGMQWGAQFVQVMSSIYVGYQANFWGGIIGLLWGFADGFIGGLVIAWIYSCCSKSCKHCDASA